MIFNTPIFFLFFYVFITFYGFVILRQKPKVFFIIVASLVFYGAWNYRFIPLLVGSAAIDYFIAQAIGAAATQGRKKALVILILNDASADTILSRVMEARAALPRIIAEQDDLVMVFGSSMTQAGFSARRFDQHLKENGITVKSFNFGFGGLNPLFQDYLSRRIRESFQEKDRRLKLALLEFNPFQTTTSRYNGAKPVIDSFISVLARPEELMEILYEDPTRGIRLLNIYYLRDSISAQITTNHFGGALRPDRPRSSIPEDEAAAARREELGEHFGKALEEDYPDYADEDWYYPWQGAGTIPEERSEETRAVYIEYFETLRTPRRLENDRMNRTSCCDITELHFEQVLVESYIRMVQNFQQFSDHVEVILLPKNSDWIQYPPEAVERLAAVLYQIESETGVTIRNFQDIDVITTDMYSDTTHLARYTGDVVFTRFLADEYGPRLRN